MRTTVLLAVLPVLHVGALLAADPPTPAARSSSVADYPSIQEALQANPGRMVYLPPGDYEISEKIRIRGDRSGLFGPGRIVQTNPNAPIVEIEKADGVRLRDVTLTRAKDRMDTAAEGLLAIRCTNLAIENVQVLDNRSRAAAIAVRECRDVQVRNCVVENYMRTSIDDRTASSDWGYAFNCIDGTGIGVSYSQAILIQGNRVIERNLLPTPELQRKHELGKVVKKSPQRGTLASTRVWDEGYAGNWHQGSAIIVTAPSSSDCVQILGNYIENAAQGIDLHTDHVIVSQNIVNNAFMGMKAMHGSRHVLILGNQFIKTDLYAILLCPGAASHAGVPAKDGREAQPANVDGGSIVANNIISDFGYGNSHWMWGGAGAGTYPIRFDARQKPDTPPLADVIVLGNVVYDSGRDGVVVDGKLSVEPPRYKHAISVTREATGMHFANNLLHPGTEGVSNVELKP